MAGGREIARSVQAPSFHPTILHSSTLPSILPPSFPCFLPSLLHSSRFPSFLSSSLPWYGSARIMRSTISVQGRLNSKQNDRFRGPTRVGHHAKCAARTRNLWKKKGRKRQKRARWLPWRGTVKQYPGTVKQYPSANTSLWPL